MHDYRCMKKVYWIWIRPSWVWLLLFGYAIEQELDTFIMLLKGDLANFFSSRFLAIHFIFFKKKLIHTHVQTKYRSHLFLLIIKISFITMEITLTSHYSWVKALLLLAIPFKKLPISFMLLRYFMMSSLTWRTFTRSLWASITTLLMCS